MDVVDKIASVDTNNEDQPVDPEQARIKTVRIEERT
jgi:cyclophilin family peptidyl-prolyl cis-trans isomerase